MTEDKTKFVESLFIETGPILKTSDLKKRKICSREIAELLNEGRIRKIKTGYYQWNSPENSLSDIETVASVLPYGIICRQSAAYMYGYIDTKPQFVSVAIPSNRTRIATPSVCHVQLIASAPGIYELGRSECKAGHIMVHIYNRERTVCDFFRKRTQLGEDLALSVLRAYMGETTNLPRLFCYADKLHIKNIILPYVKAMQ